MLPDATLVSFEEREDWQAGAACVFKPLGWWLPESPQPPLRRKREQNPDVGHLRVLMRFCPRSPAVSLTREVIASLFRCFPRSGGLAASPLFFGSRGWVESCFGMHTLTISRRVGGEAAEPMGLDRPLLCLSTFQLHAQL